MDDAFAMTDCSSTRNWEELNLTSPAVNELAWAGAPGRNRR